MTYTEEKEGIRRADTLMWEHRAAVRKEYRKLIRPIIIDAYFKNEMGSEEQKGLFMEILGEEVIKLEDRLKRKSEARDIDGLRGRFEFSK